MEIRWLRRALRNLEEEAEYIARENAAAACRVVRHIRQAVGLLADQPAMGCPGRVPGTRELIIRSTPYIVPYRVDIRRRRIEILRVFHAARRLPERW